MLDKDITSPHVSTLERISDRQFSIYSQPLYTLDDLRTSRFFSSHSRHT